MDSHAKKKGSIASVFRVYGRHIAQHRASFLVVIGTTIGLQIVSLIIPLYLRSLFNILASNVPSPTTIHQLMMIVVALSVVWCIQWILNRVEYVGEMHFVVGIMTELNFTAFDYLVGHSYQFFTSNFAGSLTHKVNKFSRAFEILVSSILLDFFPTILFVVGAVGILYVHNHTLGIILGVWSVLFTIFQIYVAKLRHPSRVVAAEADTKVTAVLADSISNHMTTLLFSGERFESALLRNAVTSRRDAVMHIWRVDNYIWAVFGLFTVAIDIGLLYGATVFWGRGLLTVGDFVLIQSYLLTTFIQLMSVNRSLRRFYDALADAQEMVAILDAPHGVRDVPGAATLAVSKGEIAFKDVDFHFSKERLVLNSLNMTIKSGEKVALVGSSGAGKSTVTKLLLRLYDIQSGKIEIDGQNIATVTQESLRDAIAFVPQEPILFHRSLMENIRYGRRDATDAEVIEAAKKAHCHEFIDALPDKYDTFVGERGVKLSGGERQRVAIARAILKNAPILILDEATSSLDSESEHLIQDSLKILMQGKTVLVIAHRLSTIMNMDRILVIENGAMIAQDTHANLLQKDGLYQKLWNIQAGGFIKDEELGPDEIAE